MALSKSLELIPDDLAPGDAKSAAADTSRLQFHRVRFPKDPLFGIGYEQLWAEFGPKAELEQRGLLARRLHWNPRRPVDGFSLLYEMIVVRGDGQFAGVRDHTAIVRHDAVPVAAVVHLSHVLVDPAWRRSGLAGWLRALPIQTARTCLKESGVSAQSPITLVAEMEYLSNEHPERMIRLKAYEKSGYSKLDPSVVPYAQPDFRPAAEIDAAGGPAPIPMCLMVRRVGRESENTITGREVRSIVSCLYHMYSREFRGKDMALLLRELEKYPASNALVKLLPPTA